MKVVLALATALLLAIESAIGKTTNYKYTQESTSAYFYAYWYEVCQTSTLTVNVNSNVVETNGQEIPSNTAYIYFGGYHWCDGINYSHSIDVYCDNLDEFNANPQNGAELDFEGQCYANGYVCDPSAGCQGFNHEEISISLHATLTPTEPPVKYSNKYQRSQVGGWLFQSKSHGSEASVEGDCTGSIGGIPIYDLDIISGSITKYDSGSFTVYK